MPCVDDNLRITMRDYWGLYGDYLSLSVGKSCPPSYPPGCTVGRQQGLSLVIHRVSSSKKGRSPVDR